MNRKQRRAAAKLEGTRGNPRPGTATIANTAASHLLAAGLEHHKAGRLDEAERVYRQVLLVDARHADSLHLLGLVAYQRGRRDLAIEMFNKAIAIKPNFPEALSNLGLIYRTQDKLADAVASYQRAIALKPDYAEAHNNLGNALKDQGKLADAVARYQHAIALKPNYAEAHNNLASALKEQGKLAEAVASYQRAIALKPDYAEACSDLAFCLDYCETITAAEHFAVHRDWNERFGRPELMSVAYANKRQPARRLKVGYVSPDFRQHSVAVFFEPLLREHDKQGVEVFCYAEVARPDTITAYLKKHSDHWLVTVGLSDEELAARIRQDGIDILVDLAGHTAKNRLGVFARKPAPVQVTWLGYPNTTGLKAIDYRLVDAVTDPPGEADALASETLVRLEGGFPCYRALADAPEPGAPPCRAIGRVTFGSFNSPAKLSPSTLNVWARLLTRLPDARLLLKGKPFADAATGALFRARLGERGIAAERVELMGWVPGTTSHLALYDRVDIALDPFPYNGTTTTCEALWMGVPVVTLRGTRHAGRVGASLLTQVGLGEWIASSVEEYLQIAMALAKDPVQLSELHRTLRPRLAASSLCDGRAFARKIEATYRTMWQHWCETTGKS